MPTLTKPETLRQSNIARADSCMLSLKFDVQSIDRSPSVLAARGSLFHSWVARALDMMRARGETHMPVEMGLELLHEVATQRDVPADKVVHLPMRESEWLRVLVTRWCEGGPYQTRRIVAIEEQLEGAIPVVGPAGQMYERIITGRPDVIIADPPDGMLVLDWKSGWAPPAVRRGEDDGGMEREDRLSDHGYVQQVVYGLLILLTFPAVQRVRLKEYYLLFGEDREATLERWKLERYRDLVAQLVGRIDAAFDEGPKSDRWIATAGTHCAMCAGILKCPVRKEAGVPATREEFLRVFREWHVSGERRKKLAPHLKGWVEQHGPEEINPGTGKGKQLLGWHPNKTGNGRSFGIFQPPEGPSDPFGESLGREEEF